MLVVVSDTHGSDGHCLTGRTLAAVEAADVVVHAGDFTTEPVLDAFEAAADRLVGVFGNNDDARVRARLSDAATLTYGGVTVAVTHGHGPRRDPTTRSVFGRSRGADLVVSGHSHRPGFEPGPVAMVNPGSHADPRQFRPAHAELTARDGGGLDGRLRTPDGGTIETFRVVPTEK
jgi:hypothetical protein